MKLLEVQGLKNRTERDGAEIEQKFSRTLCAYSKPAARVGVS